MQLDWHEVMDRLFLGIRSLKFLFCMILLHSLAGCGGESGIGSGNVSWQGPYTEGRVVDGPLQGATVFVDLNGDGKRDYDEPFSTTTANGSFSLRQIALPPGDCFIPEGCNRPNVVAIGGIDSFTDAELPDFPLLGELPPDPAQKSSVNTLTTAIAFSSGWIDKAEILNSLGISTPPQKLLSMDIWAGALAGDGESRALQRINQQLALMLLVTSTLKEVNGDCLPGSFPVARAFSDQIRELTIKQEQIDLTDPKIANAILKGADEQLCTVESLSSAAFQAASESVSIINTVVANDELDPTSVDAASVSKIAQTVFQVSVNALGLGEISVAEFSLMNDAPGLFGSIMVPADASDYDKDGLSDIFDPDDDNDLVRDTIDTFPFDNTESVDTDGDGVGNNADPDDDSDGIEDDVDVYPLIALGDRLDTDGDGAPNECDGVCKLTGMAADPDDDNDGVGDERDSQPLDASLTPPTAIIDVDVTSGFAPLRVTFDASSSIAGNPDDDTDIITSISWDTGDSKLDAGGSPVPITSEVPVFRHIYLGPGEYSITLAIKNSDGYSHTVSSNISIQAVEGTLKISGIIDIPSSYFVDSDVNDSGSTPISNDDISNAQRIFNPSVLTGYANQPLEGPDHDGKGHSYETGDISDWYFFAGMKGDVINLISGDPEQGDLDIYLYASNGEMIAYSIAENTRYESVTIPDAGGYYIEVEAYLGASTYLLEVGSNYYRASHGWNDSTEIINSELQIERNPMKRGSSNMNLFSSAVVLEAVGNRDPSYRGPLLYKFDPNTMRLGSYRSLSSGIAVSDERQLKLATFLMAKKVGAMSEFKRVQPNFLYTATLLPDDDFYQQGKQWHYDKIRMPEAWDKTTGSGVSTVAIIDSGIRHDHPDLIKSISADSYDFISNVDNAGDGDGIDDDPNDPGNGSENPLCSESSRKSGFHGTHVAGTIGATTDNSIGVAGLNWDVELMDLRVLGCRGGSSYDIRQAILYAARLDNDAGIVPTNRADVINMSLGGGGRDSFMAQAIQEARNQGVLIVASSGNRARGDYPGFVNYPASYEGVVSVGATTQADERASFSTYNEFVDISAPGVNIWSTVASRDGEEFLSGYSAKSGTSMAAPHVSAVVSLMRDIFPEMTPFQLDASIASELLTADFGEDGHDEEFGYGRIDAHEAVLTADALREGLAVDFPPELRLSAKYLNFGAFDTQGSVRAYNAGNGTLTITSVDTSTGKISIASPESSNGLGPYMFTLDRTELTEGIYQATVRFTSNVNAKDLAIQYEVFPENVPTDPNAGRLQVILYDQHSDNVFLVDGGIDAVSGEYEFSLADIPPAVYRFVSGTDLDNDGKICGSAEACALWPRNSDPDFLIVNRDYTDMSLTTGIRIR